MVLLVIYTHKINELHGSVQLFWLKLCKFLVALPPPNHQSSQLF
jgi:hypothetical protein